jgi:glycosyltransferase 2 family protein
MVAIVPVPNDDERMSPQPSMSSSLRSRAVALQWLSVVAALAFATWIMLTRAEDLKTAFSLTLPLFLLISVSVVLSFLVNGIELQVLAGRFGNHIPLGEALLLGLMVSTLNYLPLKTGTMLNGALMKVRYKVSFGHFGALVAGSSVFFLWTAAVAAGFMLLVETGPSTTAISLLIVPNAVLAALITWGRVHPSGWLDGHRSRVMRFLGRAIDGLGLIFSSGRLLAIELLINIVLIGLNSLRMMWAFEALSADVSLAAATVVTSVGVIAARLSVIPGGIGFKEGGSALGAGLVGIDPGLGLAASVVERAVSIVWLLLIGLPATLYLQRITGIDLARAEELRAGSAESAGEEML